MEIQIIGLVSQQICRITAVKQKLCAVALFQTQLQCRGSVYTLFGCNTHSHVTIARFCCFACLQTEFIVIFIKCLTVLMNGTVYLMIFRMQAVNYQCQPATWQKFIALPIRVQLKTDFSAFPRPAKLFNCISFIKTYTEPMTAGRYIYTPAA